MWGPLIQNYPSLNLDYYTGMRLVLSLVIDLSEQTLKAQFRISGLIFFAILFQPIFFLGYVSLSHRINGTKKELF